MVPSHIFHRFSHRSHETPLFVAVKSEHEGIIRMLVQAGAHTRARAGPGGSTLSASQIALRRNRTDLARIILGLGPEDTLPMCPVCFDLADQCLFNCGHTLCAKCTESHVLMWIESQSETELMCPHYGCSVPISTEELHIVAWKPLHAMQLDNKLLAVRLRAMPDYVSCPRPGCGTGGFVRCDEGILAQADAPAAAGGKVVLDPESADPSEPEGKSGDGDPGNLDGDNVHCLAVSCLRGHCFCRGCKMGAHPGLRCDEYKKSPMYVDEVAKLQGAKHCPGCSVLTYRDGGCSHMTCQRCIKQWCFLCGGDYLGHYTMGSTCRCDYIRRERQASEVLSRGHAREPLDVDVAARLELLSRSRTAEANSSSASSSTQAATGVALVRDGSTNDHDLLPVIAGPMSGAGIATTTELDPSSDPTDRARRAEDVAGAVFEAPVPGAKPESDTMGSGSTASAAWAEGGGETEAKEEKENGADLDRDECPLDDRVPSCESAEGAAGHRASRDILKASQV